MGLIPPAVLAPDECVRHAAQNELLLQRIAFDDLQFERRTGGQMRVRDPRSSKKCFDTPILGLDQAERSG